MKHFTFPPLFYKVLNQPGSLKAPGRVAERRDNVRGSQTELLDTFLKLGYLSSEALANLKAGGSRPGVPAVEAALLSGILHPDAQGWILAETLGIPILAVAPATVPPLASEAPPGAV